ncbi:hypothetical protein BMR05_14170 [Methylococcaceae bacterium HT4]|nr:hypothetical protein BMR05_14170 [Methylococcaceae bacterium HT4]
MHVVGGKLRSDVFFFDVRDQAKKHVTSFNGAPMFIQVTYKGNKTDLSQVNVVMANWDLSTIESVPASDLLMVIPASDESDGFVIFKTTEPGYFIIADK